MTTITNARIVQLLDGDADDRDKGALALSTLVGTSVPLTLKLDGFLLARGAGDVKKGDEAYGHSRGALRRGVVTKVGRKNLTLAYTTKGAVDDAVRYRWRAPIVTRKTLPIDETWVKAGLR